MLAVASYPVEGHVSRGFEAVREAFAGNFTRRHELGGACCAYVHGEKVVDLWGGVRNKATGEPWQRDTMVVVHSATKGLAAMTLALAHSRGWLDYETRVATYWPEFGQRGKEPITVRQLLAHQAGLFAFDEPVDRRVVAEPDLLAQVMARQQPAWEPGTRQAYHALTLGFYEGELMRRVDPRHRSLGQFFQDHPLGQRAGLVRAQDGHAPEMLDGVQTPDDDPVSGHHLRPSGEAHAENGWKKLGAEAYGERD
jgi:CubicO group peptidase (beta-lactamase class C family)